MGDLVATLSHYHRVGFDSPVFIYYIEQMPRWAVVPGEALRALADGQFTGVTSILTIMEHAQAQKSRTSTPGRSASSPENLGQSIFSHLQPAIRKNDMKEGSSDRLIGQSAFLAAYPSRRLRNSMTFPTASSGRSNRTP